MSEPSHKSRFAIDLDDLERQLRDMQATSARQPEADPLAELARLVGQDDPLKDVFSAGAKSASQLQQSVGEPANAEFSVPVEDLRGSLDEFDAIFDRRAGSPALQPEAEPHFAVEDDIAREVMAAITPQQAASAQMPEDPLAALDDLVSRDLDRILLETSPQPPMREEPAGFDAEAAAMAAAGAAIAGAAAMSQRSDMADPYLHPGEEMEEQPRRRLSKGALTAIVLVGVGLVGVAGAAVWRGTGKSTDGQPRVIAAEPGPSRVQPQNPGGTVVPDQNKQIYERGAPARPGESAVVNRDEQPVDVQAAVRNQPRVVFPGPGAAQQQDAAQGQAQPQGAAGATAALGEPRRVRTIAIRPDGTVVTPAQPATSSAPAATTTPVAQLPAAQAPAASPPALQQGQQANLGGIQRQQAPRAAQPAPAPAVETPQAPRQTVATAPAAPAPQAPAVQPRPAPRPAPAPAAPVAEAPANAGGGGFAVQLAAPGSENEARSVFSSLQRRFPDELGGQRPLIRRAEVNGREVYRLRVGPMSREGAADLCNKLKAKGGQCFLAGA